MLLKLRSVWVLVSICVLLSRAGAAAAQDGFARQVELLRKDDDLRVRTQAALALGASQNAAAVAPLCTALDDENYIVRMASALALSKLRKGGSQCLRQRLTLETVSSVQYTLQTSLARLEDAPPVIDDSTRFYVAVAATVHQTGRNHVPGIVRKRMRETANQLGGIAIAPSDETVEQAEAVFMKHKKLKGYYLAPKLTVVYGEGKLSLRLSIAMLSYPERNLIGQFSRSVASPGIASSDPGAEDELLAVAAESAMKQFSSVAPTL
jgi:hypothetical protein